MYLSNANLFTHNLLIFDLLSCSFLERDEAHLAEKSVEACVGLAPASHVAGELNSLPLAIDFAVLINLPRKKKWIRKETKRGGRK